MPDIVIAFFLLGLIAGLLKSDLQVPKSIYETLSMLLMLVLGLKGGMALHQAIETQQTQGIALSLLLVAGLGVVLPLLCYPVLKRVVNLSVDNAASIAAHYGSVSAGTFAVALAMAERNGLTLAPATTLYLVMLELPAIIVMLWWHKRLTGQGNNASIFREALTARGVLLLGSGVLIGVLYGPSGLEPIAPALIGGFKTMLALFLLEMGLCTAKVCWPLPIQHWRLVVFAAVAPFFLAWAGISVGLLLGLPEGSTFILGALTASASYIAAPAAVRAAIPQADIGLATLASLGVTFPINVLIGLNLYSSWVGWFY